MLVDRKCGKKGKREKVKIGGKGMKNEHSAERTGNEEKNRNQMEAQYKGKKRLKTRRKNFTFYHTLCGVGDVIQGDVRPRVSTRLRLERHSERCRVGQDDISVCPLVTMVSSGGPHQQTGAAGPDSVDLVR